MRQLPVIKIAGAQFQPCPGLPIVRMSGAFALFGYLGEFGLVHKLKERHKKSVPKTWHSPIVKIAGDS